MHGSCLTWTTSSNKAKNENIFLSLSQKFVCFLIFNRLVDLPLSHSSTQSTIRIRDALRKHWERTRFISA